MKLLFCSANCLIDPSSGAAISVRTILRMLASAGVEVRSLTSAIFDRPISNDIQANLKHRHLVPADEDSPYNGLWTLEEAGAEHFVLPVGNLRRQDMRAEEEEFLLDCALDFVDEFKPDAVLIYGGGEFESQFLEALKFKGIATLFYLANPGYHSKKYFRNVDQVLTDTKATADLYRERLDLDTHVIGKFVEKPAAVGSSKNRRHVTFINPSYAKGLTLFYRIMELTQQIMPSVRFMAVESRATLDEAEAHTGMKFSQFRHLTRIGLQRDMSTVFGMTKILLLPSLWHESGARAAIEAASLGIPTIASDQGGIPEVMGEGAILITPPEPLIANHALIPPISSAIPWVQAITSLMSDAELYAEHSRAALDQWALHDPTERVRNLVELLEATVRKNSAKP